MVSFVAMRCRWDNTNLLTTVDKNKSIKYFFLKLIPNLQLTPKNQSIRTCFE